MTIICSLLVTFIVVRVFPTSPIRYGTGQCDRRISQVNHYNLSSWHCGQDEFYLYFTSNYTLCLSLCSSLDGRCVMAICRQLEIWDGNSKPKDSKSHYHSRLQETRDYTGMIVIRWNSKRYFTLVKLLLTHRTPSLMVNGYKDIHLMQPI